MGYRRIYRSLLICLVIVCVTIVGNVNADKQHIARKLFKLLLAGSLLAPPGVGIIPIPLPLPIPFAIDTFKPPIVHGHPMFNGQIFSGGHLGSGFGGLGGFGGFGGGYGGGLGGFGYG